MSTSGKIPSLDGGGKMHNPGLEEIIMELAKL
jgi:hypothetical protein